jgi:hypothetical protein
VKTDVPQRQAVITAAEYVSPQTQSDLLVRWHDHGTCSHRLPQYLPAWASTQACIECGHAFTIAFHADFMPLLSLRAKVVLDRLPQVVCSSHGKQRWIPDAIAMGCYMECSCLLLSPSLYAASDPNHRPFALRLDSKASTVPSACAPPRHRPLAA